MILPLTAAMGAPRTRVLMFMQVDLPRAFATYVGTSLFGL